MITRKRLNRLLSTLVISFTLAVTFTFGITPAGVSQTTVNSITFDDPNATSQLSYTADNDNGNTDTYNFGQGRELMVSQFKDSNNNTFKPKGLVDQINIKRLDQEPNDGKDIVTGDRQIVFFEGQNENNDTINLFPSFPNADPNQSLMQEALRSNIVNRGSDNLFANDGNDAVSATSGNNNNIERVDYVATGGLSSPNLDKVGFLILERNGNDPFGIAPITDIDASGEPTSYGDFISVGSGDWNDSGEGINTNVLRDTDTTDGTRPTQTAYVTGQTINTVFFTYNDLGITNGEEFFGYSLFPGDVDKTNNDLIDLTDFPTDTQSGDGGLDLLASGGVFSADELDVGVTKKVTEIDSQTNTLDRADLGDEITYEITVTNNDNSILANRYNVTDTFSNELENISWNCQPDPNAQNGTDCNPDDNNNSDSSGTGDIDETVDIAPGESVIYTVTAEVGDPDAIGTETISNTAVISSSSSQFDSDDTNNSSTVEISINPRVRLIKRITKVNDENSGDLGNWTPDDKDPNDDNNVNWPDKDTYLAGAIDGVEVEPGDELEYTIYFLSDGGKDATNVTICDLVPYKQKAPNNPTLVTSFIRDAFNDQGVGTNLGIAALIGENTLSDPPTPNEFLTNTSGDDEGTFIPAGIAPPNRCHNMDADDNKNGLVVVDVVEGSDTLPPATAPGTPPKSYGFIRFRTKVE